MSLKQFIFDTYGLDGELTRLGGDLDENYLFEGDFGKHIFKLMHHSFDRPLVEMQAAALAHIQTKNVSFETPQVIPALSGELLTYYVAEGRKRTAWLISHLSGTLMAKARPWKPSLTASLGGTLAKLDKALADFNHASLRRPFHWDILQAGWVKEKLHLHQNPKRRAIVAAICAQYDTLLSQLDTCPKIPTHHDANDMNLFVKERLGKDEISGIIDFGDMVYSARIGEVAIAAAYTAMDSDDPLANAAALLRGYHRESRLTEAEIALFFPLLRMRLAVTVTNSAERVLTEPDDPYLMLHNAPGWRLLERFHSINEGLVTGYFRKACDLSASPTSDAISQWLKDKSGTFAPMFKDTDLSSAYTLDLSYSSATAVNTPEAQDTKALNASIADAMAKAGASIAIGGYGEARPIYTGAAFGRNSDKPLAPIRTHHLGVDISLAAGTPFYAPMDGTVWDVGYAADPLDYGGYVILEHTIPSGEQFYSLYGHLERASLTHLEEGGKVAAGGLIGRVGGYDENGGWWPHIHLQLMTETPVRDSTPPGACEAVLFEAARSLYPNPAAFMGVENSATKWVPPNTEALLKKRKQTTPENQKLSYQKPLHIARAWKHYISDTEGRTYIDAYNNVPHIGHCNPAVIAAVTEQMKLVSTNTRYAHDSLTAYADALTSRLPAELSVCLFTSSASEANELALRLARKTTSAKNMLVMEHGYHGITTGAMAISPYKFGQPGGDAQEDWVHITPQPDAFRGQYAASEHVADDCAADTQAIIDGILAKGQKIAGYISECLPSVGGQIVMPEGFLKAVYRSVRAAGGVCIADDVQTSLGRLGRYYWGFEYQQVVPDILVLGKPLGNGFPLAAVVTTPEIAADFAAGPEFFSTFGGSTVSCTAGLAVLNAIDAGDLQRNAHDIGAYLDAGFRKLKNSHPVIGDIRGMGLFWGLDLVTDPRTRVPATDIASYVKNRLRGRGVLIGTDGPNDNVLKIRPPMTFDKPAADTLLFELGLVLAEARAQI